jgi:hypothetical protein
VVELSLIISAYRSEYCHWTRTMSSLAISPALTRPSSGNISPFEADRQSANIPVTALTANPEAVSTGPATRISLSAAAQKSTAPKPFSEVTLDARTALDAQYAASKANGRVLTGDSSTGDQFDLSKLDRRTVFAIASNSEGKFSRQEQIDADAEIGTRRQAFLNSRGIIPGGDLSTTDGSVQRSAVATIEFYTIEASPEEAASSFAKKAVFGATYTLGIAQGAQDSDNSGELDEVSPLIKMIRSLAEVFAKQTGPDAVSADKLAEAKSGLKALFAQVLGGLPSAFGVTPTKPLRTDITV